ncbi:glycosyltransferase family 2 protein [Paraburkholderia metrosideri]|uniref:Glycosyltransferase family 2 protein n=1 Tax=Paraburkholderia metrosideri TaxID=580937 RepID=A0ABW9DZU2_9BURK
MENLKKLSAIIVNYKTADLTMNCVRSLTEFGVVHAEDIVVIDNASPDDSFKRLREVLPSGVRLARAAVNRGFGAGVNFGMVGCKQDLVLVLNPDTYFVDYSIAKALEVFNENLDVGIVGLDLKYPNGIRQYSARRFYSLLDIVGRRSRLGRLRHFQKRTIQHLMLESWEFDQPFDADWVMGTGFIIRRHMFENLGGMDEKYFLYMEDVDLCARTWQSGSRVVCVPGAQLMHQHQRVSVAGPFSLAGKRHLQSLLHFRNKFEVPLINPPVISKDINW